MWGSWPSLRRRLLLRSVAPEREYHALVYQEFGDPSKVLRYESLPSDEVQGNNICVKMLAAPINPADLNTIEGTYPLKPPSGTWPSPTIAGHEGIGQITKVGPEVERLAVGDFVVPLVSHEGTWREAGVFDSHVWHRVPGHISIEQLAMASINPPTALCMLQDFVALKEGDVVVQNGATSAVGQALIQIAAARGIHTVNIIRDRPQLKQTVDYLKSLGATLVETEGGVSDSFKSSGLPLASLGLNCVGGRETALLTKLVRKHATVVTYGGMSKAPPSIPTSAFIFKDLTFRGFWWSGHASEHMGLSNKADRIDQITTLIQSNQLKLRYEKFAMKDYKDALSRVREPHTLNKVLLVP